jgi:hypothetical protein
MDYGIRVLHDELHVDEYAWGLWGLDQPSAVIA